MQGEPAEAILEESNYFDCVVVGLRTFFTAKAARARMASTARPMMSRAIRWSGYENHLLRYLPCR